MDRSHAERRAAYLASEVETGKKVEVVAKGDHGLVIGAKGHVVHLWTDEQGVEVARISFEGAMAHAPVSCLKVSA